MIKVYVLDSNIEEISHKGVKQITDEEFKVFGKEYSIKELEDGLNHYDSHTFDINVDHIRFIEDDNNQST